MKEEVETLSRKCGDCEKEESVQRKESSSESIATANISSTLSSTKGSGNNMDIRTMSFMESRFGTDFSGWV